MSALFNFFFVNYYIVLILQGICVFHAIRKGNQNKWIWIIVFLPLIGSIAYIFTEIIQKRHVNNAAGNLQNIILPSAKLNELEKRLRFSDTFSNRVSLADEYLRIGRNKEAIDLYESVQKGVFKDDEHVLQQVIEAYFKEENYKAVINTIPRVSQIQHFKSSMANLLYALALEKEGQVKKAEEVFRQTDTKYTNYKQRYYFGMFLQGQQRPGEAIKVFQEMLDEIEFISKRERSDAKEWFNLTKAEIRNISKMSTPN